MHSHLRQAREPKYEDQCCTCHGRFADRKEHWWQKRRRESLPPKLGGGLKAAIESADAGGWLAVSSSTGSYGPYPNRPSRRDRLVASRTSSRVMVVWPAYRPPAGYVAFRWSFCLADFATTVGQEELSQYPRKSIFCRPKDLRLSQLSLKKCDRLLSASGLRGRRC